METESRLMVARAGREFAVVANGCGVSFWSHKNVLELDCSDGCLCKYTKNH